MSRKSRKSTSLGSVNQQAVIYARLSSKDTSTTIQTQIDLCKQYLDHRNLPIHQIYMDDGYSGTHMERPSLKQLLSDCDNGGFQQIIIKDLSRLGRNYKEVGHLLFHFFPSKKISLISLAEGMDLANLPQEEYIFLGLQNILHQSYALDISQKTRSSIAAKKAKGQYLGKAPYGYKKEADSPYQLLLHKQHSKVVLRIFHFHQNGLGPCKIAELLNSDSIPSPTGKLWHGSTVHHILHNPIYTGSIYLKTGEVLENTHPAINTV